MYQEIFYVYNDLHVGHQKPPPHSGMLLMLDETNWLISHIKGKAGKKIYCKSGMNQSSKVLKV